MKRECLHRKNVGTVRSADDHQFEQVKMYSAIPYILKIPSARADSLIDFKVYRFGEEGKACGDCHAMSAVTTCLTGNAKRRFEFFICIYLFDLFIFFSILPIRTYWYSPKVTRWLRCGLCCSAVASTDQCALGSRFSKCARPVSQSETIAVSYSWRRWWNWYLGWMAAR